MVDQAITLQEGTGLDVISDGEYRRFSFLDQIIGELEGVTEREGAPVHFRNAPRLWPDTTTFPFHYRHPVTGKEVTPGAVA